MTASQSASTHPRGRSVATVTAAEPQRRQITVLLYSDDVATRDAVRLAVGRRPAKDVDVAAWREVATAAAAISAAEAGGLDVLILDGEAAKVGGLGLCRQLKDEIFNCPPILVLLGRAQDAWLAAWSRADFAVPYPIDPVTLSRAVADLGRRAAPTPD
jgi:DNA-binding response OmpR family regulator